MLSRRRLFAFLGTAAAAVAAAPFIAKLLPGRERIKVVWYTNRTFRQYVDVATIHDRNVLLSTPDYAGSPIATWKSIPIRLGED